MPVAALNRMVSPRSTQFDRVRLVSVLRSMPVTPLHSASSIQAPGYFDTNTHTYRFDPILNREASAATARLAFVTKRGFPGQMLIYCAPVHTETKGKQKLFNRKSKRLPGDERDGVPNGFNIARP